MSVLRCRLCGDLHKADSKHFPITLYGNCEMFTGKGLKRKSIGVKRVVIGYACSKCQTKYHKAKFISEHKVVQKPGQRIQDAIEKMKESLRLVTLPKEQKEKQKSIVQKLFTKKETNKNG